LIDAGIALRHTRAKAAQEALQRARHAAQQARIPALAAEIEAAARVLATPAARLRTRDGERPLLLHEVETLLASNTLVIDACRHALRARDDSIPLATRPVLFNLVRALGEAWPCDATREVLVARAFRVKTIDESYRARLRVEIGRLRSLLAPLAAVVATPRGFALHPREQRDVVVLLRPVEEKYAALLALLADGEAWSSSALALAQGTSQRTVQRALDALAAAGKVQSLGHGRARRWLMPPAPGFATTLLLPPPLPED
jgi:hypothetical protein